MSGEFSPVVFALDAGATSTRAVAVDCGGNVYWRGEAPGSSVSKLGVDGAARGVADLWQKAVEEVGGEAVGAVPAAVAGGFAGARTPKIQDEVSRAIVELFGSEHSGRPPPVRITHDAHIALIGAVGTEGPGCVLISGTGSICMARSGSGETTLAGGWGWPLGDEGSATWVGWRAVQMGLEAWESEKPSELTGLVLEEWSLREADTHELMRAGVEAGREPARFADLAPGVFELASGGNPDAVALVNETGEVLGRLIETACNRLGVQVDSQLPLAFMGSLAQAWQMELEDPVRRGAGGFGKCIRPVPALMPAYGGAVLLAIEALGTVFKPEAADRLRKELAKQTQQS